MTSSERQRILDLAHSTGAIERGDFVLSSGARSHYYFDGRRLTLHPEGSHAVGKAIYNILKDTEIAGVGGPTLGADPIVASVALVSYLEGHPISAFIVRREPKRYGTRRLIEGPNLPKGAKVAILDDVITSGSAIFRAIDAAEREGWVVVKVVAILDRMEGGSDQIQKRGYDFEALFTSEDLGEKKL